MGFRNAVHCMYLTSQAILAKDMKTHPGMVREAMSHLDTFLASSTSDLVQSLSRLTSSKVIQRVCKRGLVRFLETYRKLYEDIKDPVNEVFLNDTRFSIRLAFVTNIAAL